MPRPAPRKLSWLLPLLLASLGCDAVLTGFAPDRLRIREFHPTEVERELRAGNAEIIQVRAQDDRLPGIHGARRMTLDAPVPEGIETSEQWWIVVSEDRDEGLQLAARLARAGAPRVGFTVGEKSELIALAGIRTAAREPADDSEPTQKPAASGRHPSP
ncbi:MAG: hypothetical protein QNK05_18055 [Myxococcota bacterium]|nr:hypothetical protein [Myxococcota bacterium]